jgi:uncharacterized protein (DUF302 family)
LQSQSEDPVFELPYSFGVRVGAPVEATRPVVEAALRAEGFGVLTEIDVTATLRTKLGVEVPPYLILGACNPPFAHRAISVQPSIGTLLPCNVVLRRDGDTTVIEAMDPAAAMSLANDPAIAEVATEVRARLVRVLEAVAADAGTPVSAEA